MARTIVSNTWLRLAEVTGLLSGSDEVLATRIELPLAVVHLLRPHVCELPAIQRVFCNLGSAFGSLISAVVSVCQSSSIGLPAPFTKLFYHLYCVRWFPPQRNSIIEESVFLGAFAELMNSEAGSQYVVVRKI